VTSVEILGCRVDAVERADAVERVAALAGGAPGSLVVTLGVEMVMCAQKDAAFRSIVNGAALVVCDTIGLLLASRAQRGPLRGRVTGVELLADLAERSAQRGDVRLYFLGGGGDTAERAAAELRRRYPAAIISGARDGYFHDDESAMVAAAIAASGANIVCAGLGSPKQEKWLARHAAATGCGAAIGVGGSFDVFAGNVRRAPRVVRAAGLEWAYRLLREPRRFKRQLALPRFAICVARDIFLSRVRRG